MGFDDEGIVALSGAHTLGRAFQASCERLGHRGSMDVSSFPWSRGSKVYPVPVALQLVKAAAKPPQLRREESTATDHSFADGSRPMSRHKVLGSETFC